LENLGKPYIISAKQGKRVRDEKYLRKKASTASCVEGKFVCVKHAGEIVSDR